MSDTDLFSSLSPDAIAMVDEGMFEELLESRGVEECGPTQRYRDSSLRQSLKWDTSDYI
jgi:hypothetical protein